MTESATEHRDVLTREEAAARADRISHVSYELHIGLTAGEERYRGDVTVRFQLAGHGDVFLDFRGETIELLEVNGTEATPDWTGYRLTLPGDALDAHNTVRVVLRERVRPRRRRFPQVHRPRG